MPATDPASRRTQKLPNIAGNLARVSVILEKERGRCSRKACGFSGCGDYGAVTGVRDFLSNKVLL